MAARKAGRLDTICECLAAGLLALVVACLAGCGKQSGEADGSVVKILNDGMHRVYLARMERSPIQVVYVRKVPRECPYYAFPLVNGWNDVEIVQDLPEGYIKKWHRIKDYKSLYRDFNTGFQNVGGPRGHFSNAGK